MKNFKEFIKEAEEVLSTADEARKRIAFERDVMGIRNPTGAKNIQDMQRHMAQIEHEKEKEYPEETLEKLADEDRKAEAISKSNQLNKLNNTLNQYIGGTPIKTAIDIPMGWLQSEYSSAIKSANKSLAKNPTYKYAKTKDLEGNKK